MWQQNRLTVRGGAFPPVRRSDAAPGLDSTQFWLEKPDNTIAPLALEQRRGAYELAYSAEQGEGGNYRIVGYNGNEVSDGSRLHRFSFYEFMRHGDKPGLKPQDPQDRPGYHEGRPLLELVRVYDRERSRYRSRAGNKAVVRVLFKQQPVAGVPVTLTTWTNWSKTLRTDEKGDAEFTLIKDEFQEGVLDKSKAALFLLSAEHVEPSSGRLGELGYESERYVATLSFNVYPDNNEWESKHIALLVVVATILVTGAAISINRSRRRKKA